MGQVLCVRCSDSRSRKSEPANQIRVPGGFLFPKLCTQEGFSVDTVLSGIIRMCNLKTINHIVIQIHTPCAAASGLGLSHDQVERLALDYARQLKKSNELKVYSPLQISVVTESHSVCGTEHFGHKLLGKI